MCAKGTSAAARQQKRGHGCEDISSFSTSMVKPFYRGVYKYVNYNLTKGFDDWRHETVINTDFVNSSKADREDSNTYRGETSP